MKNSAKQYPPSHNVVSKSASPVSLPETLFPLSSSINGAAKVQERLERLQKVVRAMGKAVTLEQVADTIMTDVLANLSVCSGILVLFSEDGSKFRLIRAVGYSPEMLQAWSEFPADSAVPIADACKTSEPVFLETYEERRRSYPALPALALDGRVEASLAALPLLDGQPLGAIGLRWRQEHHFDAEERAFMETLAQICAQAITRARLYDAALREAEERKQTAEHLHLLESAVQQSNDSIMITTAQLDFPGPQIVFVNPAFTRMTQYTLKETLGKTPRILQGPRTERDVLVRLRDSLSQGLPFSGETYNYRKDGSEFVIEWETVAVRNQKSVVTHYLATQNDVTERRRDQERLRQANLELLRSHDAAIEGWSRALDLRDKETEGHSERVTEMTMRLAEALEVPEEEWIHLRRGALLHDIGKMGVPDTILLKPGALTEEEWKIMRKHPEYAYELLYPMAFLRPALAIPIAHHEKWDGTGYPHGLKGEQIPLAARLFAVADVWDALHSDRPYRKGWPVEKIRDHLRSLAGTHFDAQVVETFLRLNAELI